MADITFKRGDSFSMAVAYKENNVAAPLPTTITSNVRSSRQTLTEALTVSRDNESGGLFTLTATPTDTAEWPIGTLYCDIEYTYSDGSVYSTDTFTIEVVQDITYA